MPGTRGATFHRPSAGAWCNPRDERQRLTDPAHNCHPASPNELSAVLGFTYNFENQHTDYQNGVDMHLDWGASKFLTKQWQVGLVGYVYQQISADSGSGNRVGSFESRVIGVGPQLGYVFPIDNKYQGYLNLKGYKEFDADHRAEGWNTWLTFSISAAPAKQP